MAALSGDCGHGRCGEHTPEMRLYITNRLKELEQELYGKDKIMNYFMLDGNKIPMSDETAGGLREIRNKKLFDKTVDGVRVSERGHLLSFPVRISILGERMRGLPEGKFGDHDHQVPGDILSVHDAKKLIVAIQECIDHCEAKD